MKSRRVQLSNVVRMAEIRPDISVQMSRRHVTQVSSNNQEQYLVGQEKVPPKIL